MSDSHIEKIDFRKIRDFGQTISTGVAFIRQNIEVLSRSMLYTAVPLLILGYIGYSLGLTYMIGNLKGFIEVPHPIDSDYNNDMSYMNWLPLSYVFLIFVFVGIAAVFAVMYEFLLMYMEREDYYLITAKEVQKKVFGRIWMYIGTILIFYILLIMSMIPFIMIMAFGFLVPVLGMAFVLFAMGTIVYVMVVAGFVYVIRAVERKEFFPALRRCFQLVSGYWWQTFGLIVITTFIYYSISGLFGLFSGLVMYSSMAIDFVYAGLLVVVVQVLNSIASAFGLGFLMLILAIRYFTLVEIKEGLGLQKKIDRIGQTDDDLDTLSML